MRIPTATDITATAISFLPLRQHSQLLDLLLLLPHITRNTRILRLRAWNLFSGRWQQLKQRQSNGKNTNSLNNRSTHSVDPSPTALQRAIEHNFPRPMRHSFNSITANPSHTQPDSLAVYMAVPNRYRKCILRPKIVRTRLLLRTIHSPLREPMILSCIQSQRRSHLNSFPLIAMTYQHCLPIVDVA